MRITPSRRAVPASVAFVLMLGSTSFAAKPKVPEGFEVRLVAAVPAVQYTCQVATAPDGGLYVAEDPMDQVGPYEAFHGRILRFVEGQDPTPFAGSFRAIQGMAWHDHSLYVCHMPYLTVLTDSDGDGKVDARKDLFKDLGQTENRGLNDHIVSGLQFGMDGKLYISVGDKGVPKATGLDGRTAQIQGGGSLRCNPDGTGLEVFTTGTRNHLEVNLDALDNVFTYDNTDDGLGWWTRVTHHVDGGYYGYPFDYHPRPDRHLPRMAEYGGGSPCGAAYYREDAWPEKYRDMGFWAEWGKGKIQAIRFEKDGASFKVKEMIDFAVKDGDLDFRPLDATFSYDGKTLYVADWSMGGWGRPEEKVGRVWAITPTEFAPTKPRGKNSDPIAAQIQQLDHPAYNERMRAQNALIALGKEAEKPLAAALADRSISTRARIHLVWALEGIAQAAGDMNIKKPLVYACSEVGELYPPEIRAQSVRALGMRPWPPAMKALAEAAGDRDPSVRLQAMIALGRSGDSASVKPLVPALADSDPFVKFSARQALRRLDCWGDARQALASKDATVRQALMAAMENQFDTSASNALLEYAANAEHPVDERAQALKIAAEAYRKPKPWDGKWWGTRPAQGDPPARVLDWGGTTAILEATRKSLDDAEPKVRSAALAAVVMTKDPEALPRIRQRFLDEKDTAVRCELARAIGVLDDRAGLPILVGAMRDADTPDAVRDAALAAVEKIGTDAAAVALLDLLRRDDLPPQRLPRVIAALGASKSPTAIKPLTAQLDSKNPTARAAAAEALAKIGQLDEAFEPKLRSLITDPDVNVRKAAVAAVGTLKDREAIPQLIQAADQPETRFEASLALTTVPDARSLQTYLRGLSDRNADLRRASGAAITAIRDQATPTLISLAERHELPPGAIPELTRIYRGTKPISNWQILGPLAIDAEPPFPLSGPINLRQKVEIGSGKTIGWRPVRAEGRQGLVDCAKLFTQQDERIAYAYAEVKTSAPRKAEVIAGSDDTLTVWVNGIQVQQKDGSRSWEAESDKFEVNLKEGSNTIIVGCGNHSGEWKFSVAVADATEYAFLKKPEAGGFDPDVYRKHAMRTNGNPVKGLALFSDAKGLACLKCHAVGGQGGNVGPDLAGIGGRYPREELITSVLYPSAKIFSGYEPVVVATADGRVITGIIKTDTPEILEIRDAEAKIVTLKRDEIEDRKVSNVSLMPNGLAEGLSQGDFADLIAYLETLKEAPTSTPKP